MKWVFLVLTALGLIVSALATREHYRSADEISPCSINEKWDCGTVNRSRYAMLTLKFHEHALAIPVGALGIGGYLFLGIFAFKRNWTALFAAAVPSLIFSLYLTNIEQNILEVWCLYCVMSLSIISLLTVLSFITAILGCCKKPSAA